jgi:nitroimidazol reductase NimA-like FMN-containing flavoprotein (pyridoxamine 5'-phosphate oxidase superfamily)
MPGDEVVMEELSRGECLAHLSANRFGRIGVVAGGLPEIFPVNYAFTEGRVGIRTDPGTKLDAAALGNVVFEIDSVDEASRTGWSVIVKGTAYEVTEAIDDVSEAIRGHLIDTWAPGEKDHWIRIEPTSVTGRRIRPAKP